jgi:hypothetical protein
MIEARARSPGSRRIRRAAGVTLALSLVWASPRALAAPAAAPGLGEHPEPAVREMTTEMRAESLFRAGEKKFDAGDFPGACADFQESLRLGPKLGTLLNVALCHENVGRLATAWTEYNHAAAWAAQNGQRDRYDFAVTRAQAIAAQIPRVTLHLPASRTLSAVEIDGEPLAEPRWYLPIYVDPGDHTVAVSAPGKKRASASFSAKLGQEQLVEIPPLADEEAAPPPPAPREDTGRSTRRALGLGLVGLGVVGLGVGTFFSVRAIGASSDVSSACAAGCGPDAASQSDDAKSYTTLGVVGLLSGAAITAAGVWLFVSSAPDSTVKAVRATATPGGGGLAFFGSF